MAGENRSSRSSFRQVVGLKLVAAAVGLLLLLLLTLPVVSDAAEEVPAMASSSSHVSSVCVSRDARRVRWKPATPPLVLPYYTFA
jgi:hypothetical protein